MLPQWYTALLYDKKKCMHSDEILKFLQFSKITKIFRLQIRTRIHYFMFGFNCVHGHWSLQFLQGEYPKYSTRIALTKVQHLECYIEV